MSFNIIPPQVPFTGPDGRISREWFAFLLSLFNAVGGGSVTPSDQQQALLATMRGTNVSSLESAIREISTTIFLQRSEASAIISLRQRISDLEEQLQNLRPPIGDQRVADLQTFAYGSRPWL